jgi:hypothetical protein
MKKLIKFALLVGAITAAARLISAKKQEWEGLTEEQVRSKLEGRIPARVPDEKRQKVADRVVSQMKARGKLAEG